MKDNLNVLQLICQGLRHKAQIVENYLEANDIDIAIFNETKITARRQVKFSRWHIAAKINHRWHGTLICTRKVVSYSEEASNSTDEYEYIRLKTGDLTITAAYVQPEKSIPTTELLTTSTKEHLIVGDLNAHNTSWGSNRTNDMGEVVEDLLDKGYVLLNDGKATHSKGGMLDLHLGNNSLAKKWTSFTVGQTISDHHCTISSFGLKEVKPHSTKINWKKYRKETVRKMERMSLAGKEPPETKDEVNELTTKIEEIISFAKRRSSQRNHKTSLPKEIVELMKEKKRLRRKLQNLTRNDMKTSLEFLNTRSKVNRIGKEIKTKMKERRETEHKRIISYANQSENPALFWTAMKQLLNEKKQHQPTDLEVNGTKLTSNQQKSAAFATHLASCNSIYPTTNAWSNQLEEDDFPLEHSEMTEELKGNLALEVEELEKILAGKKTKSAPGIDGVTYKDLKKAPLELKELICQLITSCPWLSTTPVRWKQTIVKTAQKLPTTDRSA